MEGITKISNVRLNTMIKLFVQVEEEIQKIHQIALLEHRLNRDWNLTIMVVKIH